MTITSAHLPQTRYPRRRFAVLLVIVLIILTVAPSPAYSQDPPPAARLTGFRHEFQTWCNCGPVNLTMALSYYGWKHDQTVAASWLKPSVEDKNVSPWEMVAYVHNQTDLPYLRALWRYGGTLDLIKGFIAAGFPVVVESGFEVDDLEWMGHYKTVVAYDDHVQTIWTYDSYLGYGTGFGETTDYAEFDTYWRNFNRVFIVIFPYDHEADVLAILGPYADPAYAAQMALAAAQQEISIDENDMWAWFNAGTSAIQIGQYADAVMYFDTAAQLGLPFRMLWYQFGPYEAYYHVGRYYDVITLADNTADTTPYVEETNYWRGMAYAALGRYGDASAQFSAALHFNHNFTPAQIAKTLVETGEFIVPAPPQVNTELP